MSEQNVAIVQRWFGEVWNNRREDVIPELLSENSIAHGLQDVYGNTPSGHEGFKSLFFAFSNAFPDLHLQVEDTVNEGELIVARCTVTGTHLGEGLGVPPSRVRVEFAGLCMMRIREGKITEVWNQFDFMNMYHQIGVLSLTLG